MTEGPTPRDPGSEPPGEPAGGPEAPGPEQPPRWESPGTPPPPPQGGTGQPDPGAAPPPPPPQPPPPPTGDQGWGQQPGGYQQPGGWQQPGGYQQPGGWQQPGGYQPPGGYQQGGTGISENVASGLSYVFTWLTGLIFYLVDKRPEVRFHAMQSIAFGLLWTLVSVVRRYIPFPIDALLWLVFFVYWIVLMIQGFQGKHFKLPVIGDFAEQQAGRPGL